MEHEMRERGLYRWGGVSALAFVVLFSISIGAYWVTGGIAFRAWVPLFSSLVCFLLVATLAGYEYLSRSQYSLARIGLGFAALAIVVLFLEAIVWGADRLVRTAEGPTVQPEPTHLLALFQSLHMAVLWFLGIWKALWGAGFIRLSGRGKWVGVPLALGAGFNGGDYLLARLGAGGTFVELWHLGSQMMFLAGYTMLGLLLLGVSRQNESAEGAESHGG